MEASAGLPASGLIFAMGLFLAGPFADDVRSVVADGPAAFDVTRWRPLSTRGESRKLPPGMGGLTGRRDRGHGACARRQMRMPRLIAATVVACLSLRPGAGLAESPPESQRVTFPGPDGTTALHGFLFIPPREGPVSCRAVWKHGSEKLPGWQPDLAHFYTAHGFVFFVPHRRGQGRSAGPYILDRLAAIQREAASPVEREFRYVAALEEARHDVEAALAWLERRPEVDPKRIVMSGVSFGGIQTLLAAEKGLGLSASVAFAPGAMTWRRVPALGERLRRAARNAKGPVLIVQAANDVDLAPSRALGGEVARRTDGSRARVFPAFGSGPEDGHSAFATKAGGIAVWGPEVLAFLKQAMAVDATTGP